MDDAKIDLIAREVLTSLKKARAENAAQGPPVQTPPVQTLDAPSQHPSLLLLSVAGGVVGSPCIVEPDQPCVGSLRCRLFGH